MKHINVVGGPGSGKSVFSQSICAKFGLHHIELDVINWQPGWKQLSDKDLIKSTSLELNKYQAGWVVDGFYHHRWGNYIIDKSDLVIFLNIPLYVRLPRVIYRSVKRIIKREVIWGSNKESPKSAITLWYWTVRVHWRRIRRMALIEAYLKSQDTEYLMFRSNKEARDWLKVQ